MITVRNGWELEQTDVDSAYLNTPLKETIYMCQPKGFEVVPGKENLVCRLNRVIYSLKQAVHEWYEHLCRILFSLGFSHCQVAHTVFYRYRDGEVLVLAVDVNDMMITGNMKAAIY